MSVIAPTKVPRGTADDELLRLVLERRLRAWPAEGEPRGETERDTLLRLVRQRRLPELLQFLLAYAEPDEGEYARLDEESLWYTMQSLLEDEEEWTEKDASDLLVKGLYLHAEVAALRRGLIGDPGITLRLAVGMLDHGWHDPECPANGACTDAPDSELCSCGLHDVAVLAARLLSPFGWPGSGGGRGGEGMSAAELPCAACSTPGECIAYGLCPQRAAALMAGPESGTPVYQESLGGSLVDAARISVWRDLPLAARLIRYIATVRAQPGGQQGYDDCLRDLEFYVLGDAADDEALVDAGLVDGGEG
jgi:hypothetical protein